MTLCMRFQGTLLVCRKGSAFLGPLRSVIAAACLVLCGGLHQAWASSPTTATTLAVTSSGNLITTVASGSVITLTATVKAGSNAVMPGQVNFCDATAAHCTDIHLLGTAQLTSSGTAVLKLIPGIGSQSYKAVFVGTTSYVASSSDSLPLVVTGTGISPTIMNLALSGAAGNYSLTATVTGNGGASPTGSVSFLDTSNSNDVLGTAMLTPAAPGLNFANSSNPAASNPTFVVTGDFNSDGIPDLALTMNFGYALTVLLGNGDGSFTAAASPAANFKPDFIAVGDFNSDGIPDLAVANDRVPSVTVLLGNGDGTFREGQALETGAFCLSVAVGDFNGDGNLDLAVTNFSRPEELVSSDVDTVSILLGNGDGTFTAGAGNPATGSIPVSSAVADFNGDGKLDLAVANYGSNTATILLGNGDGTLMAAGSPATGSEPTSIAVGDFNGDGKADLVTADLGSNTVTILLGNGDGTFAAGATPAVGSKPSFVSVGDFDGDGKPDLAVTNSGSNTVTVLLGNGDGTFTEAASLATGTNPLSVAVGYFNKDGKADLAVANLTSDSVTVLLTETESATATVNNISPVGSGTHLVDASYSGDSSYDSSISATIPLTAAAPATIPSFALSNTPVSIASPGASGTSMITITPAGGFTGTVVLTCVVSGPPAGAVNAPACSTSAPAVISGTAAVTATLTINTTAASTAIPYTAALEKRLKRIFTVRGSVAMSALLLFGVPVFGLPAPRRRWRTLLPLVVFAAIAAASIGCGGGKNNTLTRQTSPGTTIGMYTVTVTGTSGTTEATTAVSVLVN
jgi:FG-GAP-like repeat